LAVGAALADALERARRLPELGVGLHLTLVGERPLCRPEEVPSLVDRDGQFLPGYRAFLARYLRGGIRRRDLLREFRAQAAALAALGRPLDHLDSHQHLHLLPGLLSPALALAREHGIRWVRAPRSLGGHRALGVGCRDRTRHPTPNTQRPLAERRMFGAACAWARAQVSRAGLPLLDGSLGFDCAGHLSSVYLLDRIPHLPPGVTELICHPGDGDPETQERYAAWGYAWGTELQALTDPAVREALDRAGARLACFSEADQWS
jgi:predicted glycoside hydrolase/deacetylase ChbG (UPF0249 family)